MPGVMLDRVSDEATQRNFERMSAAFESIQGDPLRYAKKPQGTASAFAWLKQPIADTTALAVPSGVNLTLPVKGVYMFRFVVFFRTVITTTGIGLAVTGPPAAMVRYGAMIHQSATALQNGVGETYSAVILGTAVAAASSTRHAVIDGIAATNEPGDLSLMFRTEVAASAATLMPGTYGMVWRAE